MYWQRPTKNRKANIVEALVFSFAALIYLLIVDGSDLTDWFLKKSSISSFFDISSLENKKIIFRQFTYIFIQIQWFVFFSSVLNQVIFFDRKFYTKWEEKVDFPLVLTFMGFVTIVFFVVFFAGSDQVKNVENSSMTSLFVQGSIFGHVMTIYLSMVLGRLVFECIVVFFIKVAICQKTK